MVELNQNIRYLLLIYKSSTFLNITNYHLFLSVYNKNIIVYLLPEVQGHPILRVNCRTTVRMSVIMFDIHSQHSTKELHSTLKQGS